MGGKSKTQDPIAHAATASRRRKNDEGAQFVKYVGPLLDALRKLGGSGTPDEALGAVVRNTANYTRGARPRPRHFAQGRVLNR